MTDQPTTKVLIRTGLIHQELEEAFLNEVQSVKQADPLIPLVVLVGSRLLAQYLTNRLIETGNTFFNLRFITFAELGRDIHLSDRIIEKSRSSLPIAGREIATADAAASLSGKHYFQAVADRSGFLRALIEAFRDIDRSGIDFLKIAPHVLSASRTLGTYKPNVPKLRDTLKTDKWDALQRMYKHYRDLIEPYWSSLDDLCPPVDIAAAFERAYGCRRLYLYGFYDFTPDQLRLIQAFDTDSSAFHHAEPGVINAAATSDSSSFELHLFMPYWSPDDDKGYAFSYAKPIYKAFSKLNGVSEQKLLPACGCAFKGSGYRLFRYHPEESSSAFYPSGRIIRIFKAVGLAEEIDGIVGRINELALWENVRLDRIGVLLWHPERYIALLRGAFERAGIPNCDMIGVPLNETSSGRALCSLLSLIGKRLKRRDVVDLIAGHELSFVKDENNMTPDEAVWEKISIESGIIEDTRKGWTTALSRFETGSAQNDSDTIHRAEPEKEVTNYSIHASYFLKFIERMFDCFEEIPESGSYRELASGIENLAREFLPSCDHVDKILDVIESFEDIQNLSSNVSRERFTGLLIETLSKKRVNRGGYGSGVTLLDKMIGRGVSFDALFIPGMVQGSIPVMPREDPILPDIDRAQLVKLSLYKHAEQHEPNLILPSKKRRREEERLLFALAVDSASQRLFFSYPDREPNKGDSCLPSRFLMEICRTMLGRPIDVKALEKLPFFEDDSIDSDMKEKKPVFQRRLTDPDRYPLEWVQNIVQPEKRSFAIRYLYNNRFDSYDRSRQAVVARRYKSEYTEWDGVIKVLPCCQVDKTQVAMTDGQEPVYPITGLERYAGCPFRYWIQNVFHAEPWEEPEMQIEIPPHAIGTIIHRVLKKLYDQAKTDETNPLRNRDIGWFHDNLHEIVEEEINRGRYEWSAPRVVWELTAKSLETRLIRFIDEEISQEDKFIFDKGEEDIKTSLTFQGETSSFTIKIKGRIDRLDRTADGRAIRIIDYKTGRVDKKTEEFKGGQKLQLPLYLKALLKSDGKYDKDRCVAEYLHIEPNGQIGRYGFSGVFLSQMEEDLGRILQVITEGMKTGLFPPLPDDKKCSRCPVIAACDLFSRRKYTYESSDPRLEHLRMIQEIP